MNDSLYKPEERAIFALRELYRRYGYMPFKMSKFEEYDLYVRNKDFLISDGVITFNDQSGRLLALKPDVTLSIVKNFQYAAGCTEKVYYNENVYRPDKGTHEYKEIPQTGLECLGDIGDHELLEVLCLAAESLGALAEDYVLDLSHLGIIAALLEEAGGSADFNRQVMQYIGAKNAHELCRLCEQSGIAPAAADKLTALVGIYGPMESALTRLKALCDGERFAASLAHLERLCGLLAQTPYAAHIRLDFSIVNDMRYYNGFVFRGWLPGLPEGILAGGQYDNLLSRLGKSGGAVGFAVYLDLLEQYCRADEPDTDILLIYDDTTDPLTLQKAVRELSADGSRVTAQRDVPQKLRFGRRLSIREGRVCTDG